MTASSFQGAKNFLIVLATLAVVSVAAFWLYPELQKVTRISLSYGCLTSALVALAGFVVILRSIGASSKKFIKLVLGGLVVRLIAFLTLIALGIGLFHLEALALVVSCLTSYLIFTSLEYFYLMPLLKKGGRA